MEIKKAKKISESRSREDVDLRDYEREIVNFVQQQNRDDKEWDWELAYVDKDEVKIDWSYTKYYLDEIGYREGYVLRLDDDGDVYALDPSNNEIGFDKPENIEFVLNGIAKNARTKW